MENNKTPSIRFKGFTDPWEQRKLLSCIEKITDFRGRTPKKLGMDWSESGYLALSALNVKDGYIDFSQDVHYGEQALYDKWMSGNELHKGQVLFTTEAPMGNVAQVPDNKRYILSQRTIAFDVKEDIITENFLATLLRSPAVFNTLTSLSSGGTAKGVSQKSLAGVDIQIPVELREQELLATYFANLDNLITLHQRKYNKLLNVKKSMLEKMFPKNGSNIPEIRFKGFTDPWEQRKVFEIADRFDNLRVPVAANLRIPGNTPYYGANGIQDYVEGYTHDGEYILVAEDGASDLKNYPVNYVNGRIWVNNHAHVLQGKEKIANNKFLSYAMRLADIESVLVGGGRAKLNADIMMNLDIAIPSFNEQEQIGAYFSNLDNLITLHQRELDKLKI